MKTELFRRAAIAACAFACSALVTSVTFAQAPMQGVIGTPMDRNASGTTWIPDAVPVPSAHWMTPTWTVMAHGFVFGQYNTQRGARGDDQWGSLNWGMLMATRNVGRGQLQLRTMLSLDPATVTGRGYPLLVQTGEEYRGEPIRDRQHPHDFWMELAALFEYPLSTSLAAQFYAGPAGEPALGPVAYMHRPSAMEDPMAPLGHHWQDATHITFGVVTAGLVGRRWKLEGSVFNGVEPDDRRWNMDVRALDSWSGRLTVNPSAHWSLTAGYGKLKAGDEHHGETHSSSRAVASALYSRRLTQTATIAAAAVAGVNTYEGHAPSSSALLGEAAIVLNGRHTISSRVERVQRTVAELGLSDSLARYDGDHLFDINTISLGYTRELGQRRGVSVALGGRVSVNLVGSELERFYGSATPMGAVVFARLRPR